MDQASAILGLSAIALFKDAMAFVRDDKNFLLMATKNGTIKKTDLTAYSRPRAGGIKGIVFMPLTTPKQKIKKVHDFGGENIKIKLIGDSFDETKQMFTLKNRGKYETGFRFTFDGKDMSEFFNISNRIFVIKFSLKKVIQSKILFFICYKN